MDNVGTGRRAGRRLSTRDARWLGSDLIRVVGPLSGPGPRALLHTLREALVAVHAADPGAPPMCRLDRTRRRWVPGSALEFLTRLPQLVRFLPGAGADRLAVFLRELPAGDAPVVLAVGNGYVGLRASHAIGDAGTVDRFFAALLARAHAGPAAGSTSGPVTGPVWRRGRLVLIRALVRRFGAAPHRLPGALRVALPPAGTDAAGPAGPVAFAHTRGGTGALVGLRRWRDGCQPDASLAALEFAAVYRALRAVGVRLADGVVVLVNTRRYLPGAAGVDGNFAWGQYLTPPDAGDPVALDRTLRAELAGGRPLVMLGLRDVRAWLPRWHRPVPIGPVRSPRARPGPLTLTLTHYGRLDGYAGLPWQDPDTARFLALPEPAGPDGITVAVAELGGVLHLAAGFHERAAAPAAVRRALALVATDPAGLLRTAAAGASRAGPAE